MVCTPRDTSILDGEFLSGDFWYASKCMSVKVKDKGPMPHAYLETEPHSPES